MKKLLTAFAFIALSNTCFAQKVTLVCKGWAPVYKTFAGAPLNGHSEDDSLVIDLDMAKRVAKYSTQLGEINTKFADKDNFYSGRTDFSDQALGKFVTSINLSINRMTGGTYIAYEFLGEKDGKVAFTGTCAPGKPLF